MTVIAAVLVCLAVRAAFAKDVACPHPIECPCGREGLNVTLCLPAAAEAAFCDRLSRCAACEDGSQFCSKCEEGFEGPFCSQERSSRSRRQMGFGYIEQQYNGQSRRPLYGRPQSRCSNLNSPKLGSIRCVSSEQQQVCIGKCLPGYNFDVDQQREEMTLTCRDGVWTPRTSFPDCKSGGHCDLNVIGAGSFNCTTGMDGTRCDVYCYNRYTGRYFCYPGRAWSPNLPRCVTPKIVPEEIQMCSCQNGGTCDNSGRCICPTGRTGATCETILQEKRTCRDPGFVTNGFRRNMDGTQSFARPNFEEGQSLVYGCTSEEFALQGSSLLTCGKDGRWSSSLPRCIQPSPAPAEVTCPDPGQVANAERLNSDGTPSRGVQQYKVGQSVVYTCLPGFALQRRSFLMCLASGSWSFRPPYCTRVMAAPTLAILTTTTARPSETGIRFCRDPGVDANGDRRPVSPPSRRRGFPQGTHLEYSCNQGYDLSGERSLFCLTSGEWSATRPRCEAEIRPVSNDFYCLNPGPISNGRVVYRPNIDSRRRVTPQPTELNQPEYPEGSRLQYSCDAGYLLTGQATLICERTGFWSAEPPVCSTDSSEVGYCFYPGEIENGRFEHIPPPGESSVASGEEDEYPAGSRLQYSCDAEYTLDGPETITCENGGIWSAMPPMCVTDVAGDILYCSNPGPILNGRVRYFPPGVRRRSGPGSSLDYDLDEYPEGGKLSYDCDSGYRIEGAKTVTCQSTGFWTADPPKCVADCGRTFMQATRKIIGGEQTASGEWPWVVSISVQSLNSSRFICGGAVLNSHTVITAAHCLVVASSFVLRFGKHHFKIQKDDAEVLIRRSYRVIIHPDYANTTFDSDIGLVQFRPRIPYSVRVQPICLPTPESTVRNIMTGRIGYVAGWGDTEKELPSDELIFANLPIVTSRDCLESYRKQNLTPTITRNMFCAGYEDLRQTVCQGDSGSPLVFYDSVAERYTMEGLVSFGVSGQCGYVAGRYAVFTKVFRFLPWIIRNMQ